MSPLLATLREELARVADPAKAPEMQAYMKSNMPFHGVPNALRRQVTKKAFAACAFEDAAAWRAAVLEVWREARFREERYAAIALCDWKGARAFQDLAALPMYEEMIVSGAWWDYVDEIAQHQVGGLLRDFPSPMKKTFRAWSRSPDMWKRRTSIIGQNSFKGETDLELLHACIEPSLDSKEFFLRKAIGWALRQYAWTDPAEVVRYVRENEARLSGLSRREALKNVAPRAPRPRAPRP